MRFCSDAQRRAVFAQIKNPYDFNIPGQVQPVKVELDRGEIEQRFRMNAALMKQDQTRLKQVSEGDETSARRLQHRIANYRRRMTSDINKLTELGVDTTLYKQIRDGRSVDRQKPGVAASSPAVSSLQGSTGTIPVAGQELGLIASAMSPGVRSDAISGSLYKTGESLLTAPSQGRYQGGLAAIMPAKWRQAMENL